MTSLSPRVMTQLLQLYNHCTMTQRAEKSMEIHLNPKIMKQNRWERQKQLNIIIGGCVAKSTLLSMSLGSPITLQSESKMS